MVNSINFKYSKNTLTTMPFEIKLLHNLVVQSKVTIKRSKISHHGCCFSLLCRKKNLFSWLNNVGFNKPTTKVSHAYMWACSGKICLLGLLRWLLHQVPFNIGDKYLHYIHQFMGREMLLEFFYQPLGYICTLTFCKLHCKCLVTPSRYRHNTNNQICPMQYI
jgi:hypothetical protein